MGPGWIRNLGPLSRVCPWMRGCAVLRTTWAQTPSTGTTGSKGSDRQVTWELRWMITANWTPPPKWDYFFRWPFGHLKWPPASHLDIGHRQGTRLAWVTSRSTQPRTQVTNRAPGAEGTSRRKNTHRTDRGLRVPFADKTRLLPLAGLYPCLYLRACGACRVNVAP